MISDRMEPEFSLDKTVQEALSNLGERAGTLVLSLIHI